MLFAKEIFAAIKILIMLLLSYFETIYLEQVRVCDIERRSATWTFLGIVNIVSAYEPTACLSLPTFQLIYRVIRRINSTMSLLCACWYLLPAVLRLIVLLLHVFPFLRNAIEYLVDKTNNLMERSMDPIP